MDSTLYKDTIEAPNFDTLIQARALKLQNHEKFEHSKRWETTQLFKTRIKTADPETIRLLIEKGSNSVSRDTVDAASRTQLWAIKDAPAVSRAIMNRKPFTREYMCFFYDYAKHSGDWDTVFQFLAEEADDFVKPYARRGQMEEGQGVTREEDMNARILQIMKLKSKTLRERWVFIEDGLCKALKNKENRDSLTPTTYVTVDSVLSQFVDEVYKCKLRLFTKEAS